MFSFCSLITLLAFQNKIYMDFEHEQLKEYILLLSPSLIEA